MLGTRPRPLLSTADRGAAAPALPSVAVPRAASPAPAALADQVRILLIAAALVVVGVLVVMFAPRGAPRVNPNMTFRTLPVRESGIAYPGMSQDGKWVAFPATDASGRWDLYLMSVNDSAERRVTHDSSLAIPYVDMSPDGSKIVYTVFLRSPVPRQEVRVVSVKDGSRTVVAKDGAAARFSPDGERVGYIVIPKRRDGRGIEFWSAKLDGQDNRLEYLDSLSTIGRISFCWSPDAKWIAWIRSYAEGYQELFAVPLGLSRRERQLTRDRVNIDEVYWTRQNEVMFSSNRGGNTNLWVVRAQGGPPARITKGVGPDIGMRVSADGRTLLYLQQQPVHLLWSVAFGDSGPRRIPAQEERLGNPALSADRREIAVPVVDPDPIKPISHLVIMNRDGTGRRQLTAGAEVVYEPAWGPEGRRLAYLARAATEPAESTRVFVIDEPGVSPARPVATSSKFAWVGPDTIMAYLHGKPHRISVVTGGMREIGRDSLVTLVWPDRDYTLVSDSRTASQGLYMVRRAGAGFDTTLVAGRGEPGMLSPDARMIVRFKGGGQLQLVELPSLAQRSVPGDPALMSRMEMSSVSWDHSEMVFTELKLISKLVLVENLR